MSGFSLFRKLRTAVGARQSGFDQAELNLLEKRVQEICAPRSADQAPADQVQSDQAPAVQAAGESAIPSSFDTTPAIEPAATRTDEPAADLLSLTLSILRSPAAAPDKSKAANAAPLSFDDVETSFDFAKIVQETPHKARNETPQAQHADSTPHPVASMQRFAAASPASAAPSSTPREPSLADLLAVLDQPVTRVDHSLRSADRSIETPSAADPASAAPPDDRPMIRAVASGNPHPEGRALAHDPNDPLAMLEQLNATYRAKKADPPGATNSSAARNPIRTTRQH